MTKWDKRMLDLAELVATWSKDPSTQVGAVIVDPSNRVVSLGFNGMPRGVSDDEEILADRDEKLRRIIHAEVNALLFAQRTVVGYSIYVNRPPCGQCAAKIIQAGITRVVCYPFDTLGASRWERDRVSAQVMFGESGVTFSEVER
jgi:dCMP deaminase